MLSGASKRKSGNLGTILKWFVLPVVVCVLASAAASAAWMPWASEQDKVTKVLNDIWQALVANDQKTLKEYLVGTGWQLFVMQEEDLIKRLKIKEYDCRPKRITIDPGTASWAFVDLEKVAKLENGEIFVRRDMTVLKKVDGLWHLVVEPRKRDRNKSSDVSEPSVPSVPRTGESKGTASGDGAPAGPSMNSPSASRQGAK